MRGPGEIVAQYDIQGDAPMRMVISQAKDFLLLAMGFGGLHRVDIALAAIPPTLTEHKGEPCLLCPSQATDFAALIESMGSVQFGTCIFSAISMHDIDKEEVVADELK